ncbi:Gfo/Idh/MocA family protein [Devosia sp.]|uniref:Gfo/Idh/MocA family protein n=1 Tax=Devosia sp. TaxID=1871048 RepID=UPI002F2177D8
MLRIGILGAASIAPQALIEPARRRDDVTVQAVASRRPGMAAEYAKRHRIAEAHDGYEALLADPQIDVVYVALPPAEHARWAIAALEAGKHVLCERPFATSAAEAAAMVAAAQAGGLLLVEALHDRHHPVFGYLLERKQAGELGRIKTVKAEFAMAIPFDPKSIRHDPAAGGGALLELGCHPVHWVRAVLGEEPDLVVAASGTRTPLGVDESITATLRFPSGILADVSCGMGKATPFRAQLTVQCEHGSVEIDNPVLPHRGHSIRERLGGGFRHHTVGGGTSYDFQLQALVDALAGRVAPLTGGADAVANMRVIDAIYEKAGFKGAQPANPLELPGVPT